MYAAKCGIILFQFPVLLIRNSLTPFVGVLLARNFDGFFAFLLIVAASGHAYKDLSAAALCVVDMPVVAAAGFYFNKNQQEFSHIYRW